MKTKKQKQDVTNPQRVYAFLTDPQSKLYLYLKTSNQNLQKEEPCVPTLLQTLEQIIKASQIIREGKFKKVSLQLCFKSGNRCAVAQTVGESIPQCAASHTEGPVTHRA